MKPLPLNLPASYTVANEWLLGDSLLAAPVVSWATSRTLHLQARALGPTCCATGSCTPAGT